jgi:hypothetical protein
MGPRWRLALVALAALGVLAAPAPASVSSHPASGTPELAPTGHPEQVRQLVQCAGNMFAVGTFTAISWNGTTYARENAFSFSARPPYTVTSWKPAVNGTVNSIAFPEGSCSHAYLGGNFTWVSGTPAHGIAKVSTATGQVVGTFAHDAAGDVETIRSLGDHLLVGGFFTSINGNHHGYMASLNPITGRDDGFISLRISGNYRYCNPTHTKCAGSNNRTRVYNQQLSHNGLLDLVEGDFTSVGGKSRQQIVMLNVGGRRARVTGWTSPEFYRHCATDEPFYIRAASWSPNDQTVYVASTGYHLFGYRGVPLRGLCDVAAAFPAKKTMVNPEWINYTGCDSLYSTVASGATAYFGGHERWSENRDGCNYRGPGAISAPGMEGLSPRTGRLVFNPTHSRGIGADDMLLTAAGLWIASDNKFGVGQCGGVPNHAGICLLPRRDVKTGGGSGGYGRPYSNR